MKMSAFLQNAAWVVGAVAILLGAGLTLEWFRQRKLRAWVEETGASLESGGIISGVEVPEAARFDTARGPGSVSYHDVVRISRGGTSYALAWVHRSGSDFRGQTKSSESLYVFVTCPGAAFPHVRTAFPATAARQIAEVILPVPAQPAGIAVPGASDAFRAAYEVRSVGGAEAPDAADVARLFSPPVQAALVGAGDLIAGVEARGDVIRLQAAGRLTDRPYREMLALAESLAVHWRR